ncbi:hypothetical protein K1T71_014053 [Dendrolimus kikuchii]|uniref:Uncharacterized protein n=1 Tax=Dendrolimus kikuchii TaxID=765133 RepID=A0ACC1CF49_9NEOP|nr:hypothetical protein K1T71_014053 [Dendrolimus kikuchii]
MFFYICIIVTDVHSNGVAPLLKLNDGRSIPALGLGTWLGFAKAGGRVKPKGDEVEMAVKWAIDAGYRHIDTAYIYDTEAQVGKALKEKLAEGVVKREDIFITTKLWNNKHAKEDVLPALRESLRILNLDYVDLYLIHWPIPLYPNGSISNVDYLDTWQGMIEAKAQGLAKSIGVSNFNQQQLDRLVSLSSVKPAVLQVEINLNLQQPALLDYCRSQDIKVTGYTPFGSLFHNKAEPDAPPPRIDDQSLLKIADKYNKTVPQIALRYLVELGVIPIPKSVTKSRVEQNLQVFDFSLTQAEKDLLRGFDRHYRTIAAKFWKDSPYYPFESS